MACLGSQEQRAWRFSEQECDGEFPPQTRQSGRSTCLDLLREGLAGRERFELIDALLSFGDAPRRNDVVVVWEALESRILPASAPFVNELHNEQIMSGGIPVRLSRTSIAVR